MGVKKDGNKVSLHYTLQTHNYNNKILHPTTLIYYRKERTTNLTNERTRNVHVVIVTVEKYLVLPPPTHELNIFYSMY